MIFLVIFFLYPCKKRESRKRESRFPESRKPESRYCDSGVIFRRFLGDFKTA